MLFQEARARFGLGRAQECDTLFSAPLVPGRRHGLGARELHDSRTIQRFQAQRRAESVKPDRSCNPKRS